MIVNNKKDNKVFYISLAVTFSIVMWAILGKTSFGNSANGLFNYLVSKFGWLYLISMFLFVLFAVYLAFSKYGKIRLGPDDSKPEYSYVSWFAMLFSAGMGIGLVFWGVAEPLNHYIAPPVGIEAGSREAANFAIKTAMFHWGIHPWASYSVLALALAYFQFRKNKPGLISSIFIPLLGEERVNGPIGKLIDILAVIATIAGVATSLGLGTLQINSGLNYLFGVPINIFVQVIIVVVVTVLFMMSAVGGLDKGIKVLSNLNLGVAMLLMVLAIAIGPTVKIVNAFTNGLGMYLGGFIRESFHIEPFGGNGWIGAWRIFYWAWWIAWAPFVGTFIARISRGRTIREFITGVILVPSLGSALWFSTFGTIGLNLGPDMASKAVKVTETAFFVVMKQYPMGFALSLVAIILLGTFFVTSADSATFVLGMMTSNGDLNPSTKKKIVWGIIQSSLALALMFSGGLEMLQIGSIAAAFPFIFVMLFACVSLLKALKNDSIFALEREEKLKIRLLKKELKEEKEKLKKLNKSLSKKIYDISEDGA